MCSNAASSALLDAATPFLRAAALNLSSILFTATPPFPWVISGILDDGGGTSGCVASSDTLFSRSRMLTEVCDCSGLFGEMA